MSYALGIDVGTTYTAAAIMRDGRVEAFPLDTNQIAVPSVVFAGPGVLLFGDQAERRGALFPDGLAREFKRRLGDPVPLLLSGAEYEAERLNALMANWVIDTVAAQLGAPPDGVVVTHPAMWTPHQRSLLRQSLDGLGLTDVQLISEPEAAALDYAAAAADERPGRGLQPGQVVLVYDLGGGTFDVALLRRTTDGFEHVVDPIGLERLGGIDFNESVFDFARQNMPADVLENAHRSQEGVAALGHLRRVCVSVKESLSTNTSADLPIMLPEYTATIRITRAEFEEMIEPMIRQTLDVVDRALHTAQIEPAELDAILLVGGSSRIPVVPEMVATRFTAQVRIDAHPKLVVAKGAARRAADGPIVLRSASARPVVAAPRGGRARWGVWAGALATVAVTATALIVVTTRDRTATGTTVAVVSAPAPDVTTSPAPTAVATTHAQIAAAPTSTSTSTSTTTATTTTATATALSSLPDGATLVTLAGAQFALPNDWIVIDPQPPLDSNDDAALERLAAESGVSLSDLKATVGTERFPYAFGPLAANGTRPNMTFKLNALSELPTEADWRKAFERLGLSILASGQLSGHPGVFARFTGFQGAIAFYGYGSALELAGHVDVIIVKSTNPDESSAVSNEMLASIRSIG